MRSRSASTPTIGSSGPTISAVPCTATHSQPDRNTSEIVGFWRRLASLAVPPWDTSATTGSPLIGCGSTPAFTTDVDGSPFGCTVTTTARKCSRAPSSLIRLRPCSAVSMTQTLRRVRGEEVQHDRVELVGVLGVGGVADVLRPNTHVVAGQADAVVGADRGHRRPSVVG